MTMLNTKKSHKSTPVFGVKEVAMKRFVSCLAVVFILMTALAAPALAIGTWPTPESPAAVPLSYGSPVMIGTWPTPELPIPSWFPIAFFILW
jgi:hypothetical protein